MQPILNIAYKAAKKASDIILKSLDRIEHIPVTEKSKNDFVTDVDKAAEAELLYHIKRAYPDHAILAEESGEHEKENAEFRWIIDPLDGTYNYIRGLPHFCISMAVEHKGRIEHGLVFDPVRDEVFSASRGKGAFLNNRRLRVSPTNKVNNALLATGLPFRNPELLEKYMQSFNCLSKVAGDIRRFGSAALDLAYVAAGRFDGYWEFNLASWDLAAGALLVKEAGGYVTDFEGKDDYLKNGNILAATPKIYPFLYKAVQ